MLQLALLRPYSCSEETLHSTHCSYGVRGATCTALFCELERVCSNFVMVHSYLKILSPNISIGGQVKKGSYEDATPQASFLRGIKKAERLVASV